MNLPNTSFSIKIHLFFVQKIVAVTIEDLKRVAQAYMTKIFKTTESTTAIICSKEKAGGASDDLKK